MGRKDGPHLYYEYRSAVLITYLEEFVTGSLKLVNHYLAGDKRPWEVEGAGHCLIFTWIFVAFIHVDHLSC